VYKFITLATSEAHPEGFHQIPHPIEKKWSPEDFKIKRGFDLGYDTTKSELDIYDIWRKLLYQYTRAKLTRPSDKLAAISGSAREMQRHLEKKDHYILGIWKKFLLPLLLWEVVPSRLNTQPSEYRAPSWSWASVDIPLVLPRNPVKDFLGTVLADVCLVETGDTDDPFLGISKAFLRMIGYLTPALLTPGQRDGGDVQMDVFGVDGPQNTGTLNIDLRL
jgi:hypothetical protein